MLRLIFRQLRKHWIALVLVGLVWAVGLVLIIPQRNAFTARLSHLFARLPKPGAQDPLAAYRLVQSARARLTEGNLGWFCHLFDTQSCLEERKRAPVRLDLMENACRAVPMVHHGEPEIFRAHWLEKREHWNLTPEAAAPSSQALVEPSPYWAANRALVLLSLKDLLDASSYAYEIRPEEVGLPKGETLLIPTLFAEHARALCWDIGGALLWGDYVRFQEERALARLRAATRNFDSLYIFPEEQLQATVSGLRADPNYELALRQYLGARPPAMGDPLACAGRAFRLSCVAPEEAMVSYQKLLFLLPADRMFNARYSLGLHYFMMGRKGNRSALGRAVVQLRAASASSPTGTDARKNLVRIYLMMGSNLDAYNALRELHLSGTHDSEYRTLARAVLFRLGRFKDADCFSDEAGGLFGRRPHCREFRL